MVNLFDAEMVRQLGPHEFRRSIQRLLLQNGFDAFSVDGPGDGGGDIFAERNGERWVVQCKWKKNGVVSPEVVEEAINARSHYDAHVAIIATNQRISDKTDARLRALAHNTQIHCWNGDYLRALCDQSRDFLEPKLLRPYQAEAVGAIQRDLLVRRSALLYLATGLGKTVVAGAVIRSVFQKNSGAKVLVLAHMTELMEQLQRALWADIPISVPSQLVDGNNKPAALPGLTVSTNISIIEYLRAGYRPDLVVIDECHHVGEDNNYAEILHMLIDVPKLGVTATPWRGDGFDLERAFGIASFSCGIEDGMRKGYLAKVDYKLYCDNINWDEVHDLSRHSYSVKDLNRKLFLPQRDESILEAISDQWNDVPDPKCIIFCQSVEHARQVFALVRRDDRWRRAEILHSQLDKNARRFALLSFRHQRCPMLIAVDILNEGVDVPSVNIVCFARVTHSRKIFVQQLGRGLRVSPGKDRVVVVDFAADARRMAAVSSLQRHLSESSPVEMLGLRQNRIEFNDQRAQTLIEEWIADAADLETKSDESRLQFPQLLQER